MLLLLMALLLAQIPVLSVPFGWLTTFFHEISHGLVALLTGGSIESIRLRLDGSGLCISRGGNAMLMLLAGYSGAVLWGMLIYRMAQRVSHRYVGIMIALLALLLVFAALCYARDGVSWLILAVLLTLMLLVGKLRHLQGSKLALRLIGMYIMLDAVRTPLYLLYTSRAGDAAALADITLIPRLVWIALWVVLALTGLYMVWRGEWSA